MRSGQVQLLGQRLIRGTQPPCLQDAVQQRVSQAVQAPQAGASEHHGGRGEAPAPGACACCLRKLCALTHDLRYSYSRFWTTSSYWPTGRRNRPR